MPDGDAVFDLDLSKYAPVGAAPPAAPAAVATQVKPPSADQTFGLDLSKYAPAQTVPPKSVGVGQNFLAGANRAIFSGIGAPVDIATKVINFLPNIQNSAIDALTPNTPHIPTINNPIGGSDWLNQRWADLTGVNPSQVQPTSEGERMAQAAGGAVAQVP